MLFRSLLFASPDNGKSHLDTAVPTVILLGTQTPFPVLPAVIVVGGSGLTIILPALFGVTVVVLPVSPLPEAVTGIGEAEEVVVTKLQLELVSIGLMVGVVHDPVVGEEVLNTIVPVLPALKVPVQVTLPPTVTVVGVHEAVVMSEDTTSELITPITPLSLAEVKFEPDTRAV